MSPYLSAVYYKELDTLRLDYLLFLLKVFVKLGSAGPVLLLRL